jgi:hypothetical protein
VLLDFGLIHNFILEAVANSMALPLQCRANMMVIVGNNERDPYLGDLCQATFSIDGEAFHMDLFIQPLASYDIILDTQWPTSLCPIIRNFHTCTMSFWCKDHQVH